MLHVYHFLNTVTWKVKNKIIYNSPSTIFGKYNHNRTSLSMECLQLMCHPFLFSKQLHHFVVHNKKNKPFYQTSTFVPGLDPSTHGLSSRWNDVEFKASSIVRFCSVYQHFDSRTVLSSTMPSGEAPRIPEESNQIPVS